MAQNYSNSWILCLCIKRKGGQKAIPRSCFFFLSCESGVTSLGVLDWQQASQPTGSYCGLKVLILPCTFYSCNSSFWNIVSFIYDLKCITTFRSIWKASVFFWLSWSQHQPSWNTLWWQWHPHSGYLDFYNLDSSTHYPTLTWKVKTVSYTVGFCPDTCDVSAIFISMLMGFFNLIMKSMLTAWMSL